MSLAPCSSSVLPRQRGLSPCSESSERICPLEILKSKEQEGTATSLGICPSKKWRYIKDSCYFWGRCAPGRKIPVFTQRSVLHFLETRSSAVRNSCDRVPANPNLQLQGWEFPHMFCTGWSSPGKWEQRKLSCPICPWWLLSKNTPAVLLLCKHCHTAMVCVSATRFKQFLIHTLYKPRKHCAVSGCFVQCSCWHEGPHTACCYWGRGTDLGCWVLLLGKNTPGELQTEVA